MTKTSIAVMIIPAMIVYFKVLNEYVENDKKIKDLLIYLIILTVIILPLGVWFHIYWSGESLGIIKPVESFSIADKTLWERFGLFNPFKITNVNIWNTLMITSINYIGVTNNIFIQVLIALDIILVIGWLYYFVKSRKDYLLITTSIMWWVGYFYLNITMPYSCSMNARYMVIPMAIGIIDVARGMEKEESKFVKTFTYSIGVLLSIVSVLYFIFL